MILADDKKNDEIVKKNEPVVPVDNTKNKNGNIAEIPVKNTDNNNNNAEIPVKNTDNNNNGVNNGFDISKIAQQVANLINPPKKLKKKTKKIIGDISTDDNSGTVSFNWKLGVSKWILTHKDYKASDIEWEGFENQFERYYTKKVKKGHKVQWKLLMKAVSKWIIGSRKGNYIHFIFFTFNYSFKNWCILNK